jgi:hypothetical protein
MSSSIFSTNIGRAAQLFAGLGLLAVVAPSSAAQAQSCRLDYQRAESATALGASNALGIEQLSLSTNQQQGFITDAKYETTRGTPTVRYGSHLRSAVNRGAEPVALGLVGPAAIAFASAPGAHVAQAMGGAAGGIVMGGAAGGVVMGGLSGGVVQGGLSGGIEGDRSVQGSWILLQPGERIDNLRHDLAVVACGESNAIVRAVTDVLRRASAGSSTR